MSNIAKIEWLLQIAFAAMLPAMMAEPMIVGVKLVAQGIAARLGALQKATSFAPFKPSAPVLGRLSRG